MLLSALAVLAFNCQAAAPIFGAPAGASGTYDALVSAFPAPATVVPVLGGGDGEPASYKVTLGKTINGVVLPDDLGEVSIFLNGCSIRGADGESKLSTTEQGTKGTSAIVFTHSEAHARGPTKITVLAGAPQDTTDLDTGVNFQSGWYLTLNLEDGGVKEELVDTLEAFEEKFNQDEYKTTKMVFRRVPAGCYVMQAGADPHGLVTLTKDYCISVFELTQKQYQLITGKSGVPLQVEDGDTKPIGNIPYKELKSDVVAAINAKLGGENVYTAAMPTEAQWERAARAGSAKIAFVEESKMMEYAHCGQSSSVMASVGSKKPNAWGLYDVYGNVREYCADAWRKKVTDAFFGTDPSYVKNLAESWVARGSSYTSPIADCTSVYRRESQTEPAYGVRLVLNTTTSAQPFHGDDPNPGIWGGNGGDGAAPQKLGAKAEDVTTNPNVQPGTGIDRTKTDAALIHDGLDGYVLLAPPQQNFTVATYNGSVQTAIVAAAGVKYTGTLYAKDVGKYTAAAEIDATNKWLIAGAKTQERQRFSWSIVCAGATVTADPAGKVYGETDPALTASEEGVFTGDALEYELKRTTVGRDLSDTKDVEGDEAGVYRTYFEVGGKEIFETTVVTQGNYAVKFVPGYFTIEQKVIDPTAYAAMLASFTNATYTFDGRYHGTAVMEPLPEGILSVSYSPTNEFLNARSEPYAVTATFTVDPNYVSIDATHATVTIRVYEAPEPPNPALFACWVRPTASDYTGKVQSPEFAARDVVNDRDLMRGIDYDVAVEPAVIKDVGTYTCVFTGKGNYGGVLGIETYKITRKTVTVTPAAKQAKAYGEAEPTFTNYTWRVADGRTVSVTGGMSRVTGENVGTYAFLSAGLAVKGDEDNYRVVIAEGAAEFAITNRALTAEMITIAPETNDYNGAVQVPAVEVAWAGAGDTALSDGDIETRTWLPEREGGAAAELKNPGEYWYVVTASEEGNFSGVASNRYVIEALPLTITAADTNLCYGIGEHSTVIAYEVEGEFAAGHSVTGALSRTEAEQHKVGSYGITKGTLGVQAANGEDVTCGYAIDWELGSYTITNKVLTAEMFTMEPTNEVIYAGVSQGPAGVKAFDEVPGQITPDDYAFNLPKFIDIGLYDWLVWATEKGNYSGEVTLKYQILPIPFEQAIMPKIAVTNAASELVYDAREKTPGVKITTSLNGMKMTLIEGEDYTIEYFDNVNVGEKTATVKFTGKLYSGETTFTYAITPATLAVRPDDETITYGDELPVAEPGKVTITGFCGDATRGGVVDEEGLEYDFGGFDGLKACVTNFVAKGLAFKEMSVTNYAFKYEQAVLTVAVRDIAATTTVTSEPTTYDGKVKKPVLSVSDVVTRYGGEVELITTADWTATWEPAEIRTAGTYTVTLAGHGNYAGTYTVPDCHTVMPRIVEIEWGATNFTYTGAAQKPEATVANAVEGDEVLAIVGGEQVELGAYVATVVALEGADAPNYAIGEPAPETPFDIVKSDEQLKLEEIFGVPENSTVTPQPDADGKVTNWVVTLNVDTNGVIDIPDNLGNFTLDLNGHDVAGADGANGGKETPGEDGEPAFRFVKGEEPDHGVTQVTVTDSTGTGEGSGRVTGGNGGHGNPYGEGAKAFAYADGANAAADYAADFEGRVIDGRDGIGMLPEVITLKECRGRYPWQAAIDATYEVADVNTNFYDYKVVVTVTNEEAGAGAVFERAMTEYAANGTNSVWVVCDGLEAAFGDDFAGEVTVKAELWEKALTGISFMAVGADGYATVTGAEDAVVSIDCRAVKPLRLSDSAEFNISSNEWDTTDGGAAHVAYTRNGAGEYTLDPVADRVMKHWEPARDGEYAFTLTPGGDTATFAVAFPANVTNSFPEEVFDVSWNAKGTNWTVQLKENLTGPLEIADDIGRVTLDLAGHTVTGTNGVDGAGGDAIDFTAMDPEEGLDKPTELTLKDTDPQGHSEQPGVRGGDGASGATPGVGGAGISTNGPVREGVQVIVQNYAWVRGGNGGDSVSGEGAEGGKGITVPYDNRGTDSIVEDGAKGQDKVTVWAWCELPEGATHPLSDDGVSLEGNVLKFFKCNNEGSATFDFGLLLERGWVPEGGVIHFVEGEIPVAKLVVPETLTGEYADMTFVGDENGTLLKSVPKKLSQYDEELSVFVVRASGEEVRRFRDLAFVGCDDGYAGAQDGGAINMKGGILEVSECVFRNCHTAGFTGELGGAICAVELAGDSLVTNTAFENCWVGVANGYGGAIYATAKTDGLTLTIADSKFTGNRATSGGAVTTMRIDVVAEHPIALAISGSQFAENKAVHNGGALMIETDASVTNTVFEGNRAEIEGGAICSLAIVGKEEPMTLRLRSDTLFRGNVVANDKEWTCGGAVAVMNAGATLVTEGRHVIFDGNRVAISEKPSYGGAVYLADGTAANIELAGFLANDAGTGGGAVFAAGSDVVISTCIFSNNVLTVTGGRGGAVGAENTTLVFSNCTVRGSNQVAVDLYETDADVVNCVIADNGSGLDLASTTAEGGSADLTMLYTSYGRAGASETVSITTNGCISGTDASVFRGETLLLNSLTNYLAEAAEGLVQEAYDYSGWAYGSHPEGTSMGAYECPTPKYDPIIEIVETEWFHNRGNGLYYPRITVKFVGGDAARITALTLKSESGDHELPQQCVDEMLMATNGQLFVFGVDPDKFPKSYSRTAHDGYIIWSDPAEKERVMLFGEYESTRPLQLELEVAGDVHFSEVVPVFEEEREVSRDLPRTVEIPARFEEFAVGEKLTGRTAIRVGTTAMLQGCEKLGDEWIDVCLVEIDVLGRFETEVPEGLFFFKLVMEVPR